MKKPTEAIERMRGWSPYKSDDMGAILAYLDSLPEWPVDLTREEIERRAKYGSWNNCMDALLRLAAIAPKREKRKVTLWEKVDGGAVPYARVWCPPDVPMERSGWRKVGECEVDA